MFERELITRQNEIMRRQHEIHQRGMTVETLQRTSSQSAPVKSRFASMYSVVFEKKEFSVLRAAQRRHRAIMLARAIMAASLMSSARQPTLDEMADAIVASPQRIDLTTNDFEQIDKNKPTSDIVFLSRLTSAFGITQSGVLVRSHNELTWIRGPWNVDRIDRSADHPFLGVALSTGTRYSNATLALPADIVSPYPAELLPSAALFWSGDQTRPNMLLDTRNARTRTDNWKRWEETCGANTASATHEQPLYDVCVRQAQPQFITPLYALRPEDVWN